MRMRLIAILGSAMLLAGCENSVNNDTNRADLDNTAVNQRDADGDTKTPFDQSNTTADTELVAKLRSGVLEIDDLSINGRNIKIITNNGSVQLRGPVETDAERDAILNAVNDIAGASNVTNLLEVKQD